jgi:hypothetical protein
VPFIKGRARGKYTHKVVILLDDQNHETLHGYSAFIDESVHYVVNELIDVVLARNARYRAWRREHPDSYEPSATTSPRGTTRRRARTPAASTLRVPDAPAPSRGSTV